MYAFATKPADNSVADKFIKLSTLTLFWVKLCSEPMFFCDSLFSDISNILYIVLIFCGLTVFKLLFVAKKIKTSKGGSKTWEK